MSSPRLPTWAALHLHHHGSLDDLLTQAVAPVLRRLVGGGEVDRFYFVRYLVAGPHLRLRLRLPNPEAAPRVEAEVRSEAAAFFALAGPGEPWPEEKIRRINRNVLRHDPGSGEDEVIADRTVLRAPFQFEAARYGAAPREDSLALFTLSSLAALDHQEVVAGMPGSRRLGAAFGLLAHLAAGLGTRPGDLGELLAWARPAEIPEAIRRRVEDTWARSGSALAEVLGRALGGEPTEGAPLRLREGAGRLAAGACDEGRGRLLRSHLHMTANRLGLGNAEETYLSCLLARTHREIGEPEMAESAGAALPGAGRRPRPLDDLVTEGLQTFASPAPLPRATAAAGRHKET